MNPVIRNVLATAAGVIIGGGINYALVYLGHQIIEPPAGIDPMDPESLNANMNTMSARHFILPILAHAAGTFAGAFIAVKLAASRFKTLAMIIGFFYLIGGISATFMINPPIWVIIVDLGLAYLPMAWLGWKLAGRNE